MFSVVAGSVFVGLEMRQSQQIALAAQQQARMEVFVDAVGIMSDGGVSYQNFVSNGIIEENETHIENFLHQLWWISKKRPSKKLMKMRKNTQLKK